VLLLPYKQDCKIGVECMAFEFRNEMLWLSYCDVSSLLILIRPTWWRPGFMYNHYSELVNEGC
jgi:hypothetical protein